MMNFFNGSQKLTPDPRSLPLLSEVSQPRFDFVVRHHVVGGEQTFLRKDYDPPMQPGAALEQILPQSSDSDSSVQVGTTEAVTQRAQGFRDLFPIGIAQFFHPFSKAGMEIDPHSLPVKVFVWPDARALRTSVLTAWKARSACFPVTPYSCRA